jgi:hypothetical protein
MVLFNAYSIETHDKSFGWTAEPSDKGPVINILLRFLFIVLTHD